MVHSNPVQVSTDMTTLRGYHEETDVFTEAVFAKGRKQIEGLEPFVVKIQAKLKEFMTKGGKVNLDAFWKDTVWRDFEHKLMSTFGFKTIIINLTDDGTTKRGGKINLPNFNVWINPIARYPIEALVTDDGFYDKSRSLEALVTISPWFILNLTPSEFMAVFLHEMGHGIDPAIMDIRYVQTNLISDYLMDRKIPKKKETRKLFDKAKGFLGEVGAFVLFYMLYILMMLAMLNMVYGNSAPSTPDYMVPNNWFSNAWSRIQRLFMGKEKYDQYIEEKYASKLKKVIEKQYKKFTRYNNPEAYADNFPRMYGYASELVSALQKMKGVMIDERYKSSWMKKDIERRKYITNMLYHGMMDEHGSDVQRIQNLIKEYDKDLRDPKIPDKVKKSLKEDRDELVKVANEYLNHFDSFHNKMNKVIFDALNEGSKSEGKSKGKSKGKSDNKEGD